MFGYASWGGAVRNTRHWANIGSKTTPAVSGTGNGRCRTLELLACGTFSPVLQTTAPIAPPVTFFRPRRRGPESVIEDCVIEHLPALFGSMHPAWMAGSVPLGAGMPDLIVASYQPLVA